MVLFFRALVTFAMVNGVHMFKPVNTYSRSRSFFHSMKKDNIELKSLSNFYKPKTVNQELYVKHLNDPSIKILFSVGPAGTGKTMLACNQAIKELKNGNINKIIITRPVVPVEEEEIGFLPGNINKKMDPWTRPLFDIFYEFYQKRDIETMLYNNVIEISPLAFMRGRTFKNAFIIADEMQNSSPNQMLMLTTRIGDGSKMVITGDLKQSDRGINSGLSDFIGKYKLYNDRLIRNGTETNFGIKIIELTTSDIERSKVINKLLEIYDVTNIKDAPIKNNNFSISNTVVLKENDTPVSNNSEVVQKKINNEGVSNNDAALIPLSHMSRRVRE